MQKSLVEKDLTYGGIREDAAEERPFSPESFVFNVGLPTLMDMEGCMAVRIILLTTQFFYEGCFFLGHDFTCNERVGERRGRWKASEKGKEPSLETCLGLKRFPI